MATLTRQLLSTYDSRLAELEGSAYDYASSRIASFLAQFPKATAEQVREFAVEKVDEAVLTFGDGASSLAADLYENLAQASGAKVKAALVDTSDVSEYIQKEVRYQLRKYLDGDSDGFTDACAKKAKDQVQRRANETMRVNAKRDGLRYARVPMGGETCTFCAMLASRGFVYRSAKAAGEGTHYHANCRCKVVPEFKNMNVEGYDPKEWLARWDAFKDLDGMGLTGAALETAKKAIADGTPTAATITLAKETARRQSAEELAARSVARAAKQEKSVTKVLQSLESDSRQLEGLDFRLKGEESLARKILSDANEEVDKRLTTAADEITDVLRYTFQCDVDTLSSDFSEIREQMESLGYDFVKVKNTLGDATAPYRGVNTKIKTPDGYEFELQFHTAESLEVKEVNHKLYEEQRVLDMSTDEGRARSAELAEIMAGNASGIATPPGIEEVKL